ncbi:transglutaminase family protein [Chitinophagaceae bacterium LB-8]|uniref:Transglutaminase family protein n=1 Tax=Paraflavisolibacter caeni TaxID=2982496 RepID=A0A9X2XVS2_9BACT|nr:transglutaminase family protein [Paraflavisolibacter caeni]MCU7549347.1 transglutaminase family protein [Paraflavisolibacter caeni]
MAIFKLHHITKYEYDRLVKESINEIKIFPYQCAQQEIVQQEVMITGNPAIQTFIDYWGNKSGSFNLLQPHSELVIESRLVIRTTSSTQLSIDFHSGFDDLLRDVDGQINLLELSSPERIVAQDEIEKIIQSIYAPNKSVAAVVEGCCEYIYKYFKYKKGITTTETTIDEILDHQSGVCQDFAHLMLQILRTMKIPSRYVSGYICPIKNGMRGEGATHAWVDVWIPNYGWAGIDPTNNIWVTNRHIKLAVGRNFVDCTPIKGTFKGPALQKLSVYVSIGYEDGQIFEDMNDVDMETQQPTTDQIPDYLAGQQQQQ